MTTPSSRAATEVIALNVEPTALVSWMARLICGKLVPFLTKIRRYFFVLMPPTKTLGSNVG